ncbi:MAG: single-strand binding protein, partial [Frankiales bacterium]|nr:single-strand binding protein [Frankiales bacterium]
MHEPLISLTGNLAFDPTLRYTPNGVAVVDLRVASTQRRKAGEDWEDGETLWFDVACWKQLAENANASLHKGDRVTVTGRLAQKSWTREDGSTSVRLVVDATALGIDLTRHRITVVKPVRESAAEATFPDRWADTGGGPAGPPALGDAGPLVPVSDEET